MSTLQETLDEMCAELDVPGVSAAVLLDGEATCASHGVTSVENPLAVDERTLFQIGSTSKTVTATAVMVLVEQGRVDLQAPARTYVPELATRDPGVAERVTVLQLLNHTAGWDGDLFTDTGRGDDALARYVAAVADLEQISPLGSAVTYNNAALSVAGRVVEKVVGATYEDAVRELVLEPLGLHDTLIHPEDVMLRRFAVGHVRGEDGATTTAHPWPIPRGSNPAGGWSATVGDQVAWARFHLGDGTAPDGTRVLGRASLERMRTPTADMAGSALGDAVGISWLLRDVGGVRVVEHGGTTNGQFSTFLTVPERGFALVSTTNGAPDGPALNRRLQRWALEHHLGVREAEPEPVDLDEEDLRAYAGRYETVATLSEVTVEGRRLRLGVREKPQDWAPARDGDEALVVTLTRVAGPGDPFVTLGGTADGLRGYFARGEDGQVTGVHFGGRLARRTGTQD